MNKIGFVGTGKMGLPIACTLLKEGYAVTVCDPHREAPQVFTKRGGRYEASLGRLAAHCDIMFLCLRDSRETEEAMHGPEGILAQPPGGKLVIDLGGGDPYRTERIAQTAEATGVSYLDASVEGGVGEAAAGTLTIMVGGSYAAYEKIESVLKKIARNIFYMGASGTGHKARLIHTMICWAHLAVLCEAMVLGVKAGLEPEQILTVINAGAAESQVSSRYGSLMIKNNGNAEDTVLTDHQDMEHILAMETQARTTLPLVGLVSQLMVAAKSRGLSAGDISAVLKLYAELARITMGAARGN